MKLFIGLMSGTSMDGIDAVLIDLSSNTFITGITCPYSPEIKQRLLEVNNG
ncbi:anhydro-N-acetylmuramic acid kinase, partial [Legionella tunisiensis]|uniref:anhydro-N-acetylmuramic acid kinase n=1 Tax=Legionella tunisiensis TaxID=1034944 RepID=UPI0018DCE42E